MAATSKSKKKKQAATGGARALSTTIEVDPTWLADDDDVTVHVGKPERTPTRSDGMPITMPKIPSRPAPARKRPLAMPPLPAEARKHLSTTMDVDPDWLLEEEPMTKSKSNAPPQKSAPPPKKGRGALLATTTELDWFVDDTKKTKGTPKSHAPPAARTRTSKPPPVEKYEDLSPTITSKSTAPKKGRGALLATTSELDWFVDDTKKAKGKSNAPPAARTKSNAPPAARIKSNAPPAPRTRSGISKPPAAQKTEESPAFSQKSTPPKKGRGALLTTTTELDWFVDDTKKSKASTAKRTDDPEPAKPRKSTRPTSR